MIGDNHKQYVSFKSSTVVANLTFWAYGVPMPRLTWSYNNTVSK